MIARVTHTHERNLHPFHWSVTWQADLANQSHFPTALPCFKWQAEDDSESEEIEEGRREDIVKAGAVAREDQLAT